MGGSGSGRSAWRNRGTVEAGPALSVVALQRAGALQAGAACAWQWSWGSSREASVSLVGKVGALAIAWRSDGQPQGHEVRLEWQPCRFGGSRPWFRCPALGCGRRAGRIHLVSNAFVCRKCARLVYRSQRADLSERGWMKIRKAYRALGLEPDEAETMENLPKPRGMHWRTFQRHWEALERGAEMRDAWMLRPFPRSLMRLLEKYRTRD